MLTAEEARAQMPDKEKAVHDNVQSICNDISLYSRNGLPWCCVPITFAYVDETIEQLRKLGYIVEKDGNLIKIIWGEQ